MIGLLDFYMTRMKMEVIQRFTYRLDGTIQILGKFIEPVIYLVVWKTVAEQSGGEVGGYTVAQFAGYFIVWTMVRMFTMGWSPWQMEYRIRQGDFNRLLLRPIHPIHDDTAQMLSWKLLELMNVIPTMVVLTLLFKPEIEIQGWAVAAFIPALLLGFATRYIFLWAIALVAFWTTRVNALFNLMFAVEFLISGRIAPISVLPEWAQQIAHIMPFYWMFGFPLDLLIGRLTQQEALTGMAIQAAWVTVMTILLLAVWRVAVKRYSAVGG